MTLGGVLEGDLGGSVVWGLCILAGVLVLSGGIWLSVDGIGMLDMSRIICC